MGRLNADLANDLGNLVSRATTVIVNFGGGAVPAPGRGGRRRGGPARALGAHRRRGGDGDGRVRLPARARRRLGVHRRREPLRRHAGAVDPRQGSRRGRAPAHRALDAWASRSACLGILLDRLPARGGGQDPRAAIGAPAPRLADLPWGGLAAGTRGAEGPGSLPPRGHEDARRRARAQRQPKAEGGAQGDAARRRSPSPTSRRWTCAWPRWSPPRRVPKSKKLLKLTVKVGEEPRTLVAGIAEHYAPAGPRGPEGGGRRQSRAGHAHGQSSPTAWCSPARSEGTLGAARAGQGSPAGAKVK